MRGAAKARAQKPSRGNGCCQGDANSASLRDAVAGIAAACGCDVVAGVMAGVVATRAVVIFGSSGLVCCARARTMMVSVYARYRVLWGLSVWGSSGWGIGLLVKRADRQGVSDGVGCLQFVWLCVTLPTWFRNSPCNNVLWLACKTGRHSCLRGVPSKGLSRGQY